MKLKIRQIELILTIICSSRIHISQNGGKSIYQFMLTFLYKTSMTYLDTLCTHSHYALCS